MGLICDMDGVRGSEPGFPVQLIRDDDSGRLCVRGVNEGGFACIDIDLIDLLRWLGVDLEPNEIIASERARTDL